MAGALLTAAGLQDLITTDLAQYEERAVALAQQPAQCRAYREHLRSIHDQGVVFDTAKFVRNLEHAFEGVVPGRY